MTPNIGHHSWSWMFPYLVAAKCNYFGGITFYQNFVFKCSMDNCAKIVINISNFLIRQILRIFLIKPAIMISITKFRPFPKPIFIGNFLNFSFGVKLCRNVRVTSYHLIENRQNTLNPRFYGRTWAEKVVERGSHDISLLHHYSDSDSNLWPIGCQARMHLLLPKLHWRIAIYISI